MMKREEDPHPVSPVVANSILVLDLLELNNTVGKIDYTYVVYMYQIHLPGRGKHAQYR